VTAAPIPLPREPTMPIFRRLPAALVLLAALGGCARPALRSAVPDGIGFVSREDWGARDPVLPMRRHRISRLTIHHTAVRQAPARSTAEKLRGLQQFSQREDTLGNGRPKRAWADVPYHLYVASDGSVAEGREWRFVGDSNTPYDPTGHLQLVVEGNFEEEPLTEAQRRTLERLVPALVRRFRIPPASIAGHGDHAETLCPGKALEAELPRLRELAGGAR
jgi:N-acetylmuramoyl-L-alanine amidase-like protein